MAGAAGWSLQKPPSPSPGSAATLSGVSCPSASECIAVGSSTNYEAPVAERWNGTHWSVLATPTHGSYSDGTTALLVVSCPGVHRCVAVGNFSEGGFAERWNGASWRSANDADSPGHAGRQAERDLLPFGELVLRGRGLPRRWRHGCRPDRTVERHTVVDQGRA